MASARLVVGRPLTTREFGKGQRLLSLLALAVVVGGLVALSFRLGWVNRAVSDLVVRLELVGSYGSAKRLFGGTGQPGINDLLRVLRADLVFIVLYSFALALAARWVLRLYRLRRLRKLERWAPYAAMAAAVLDGLENGTLWAGLTWGGGQDGWFLVAASLAWAKFVIIAGLLLLILGAVVTAVVTPTWLYHRLDQAEAEDDARAANPAAPSPQSPVARVGALGIALSGGGVRAASVSLGALQALEAPADVYNQQAWTQQPQDGWNRATRVTAVSGGAYMGAAWQIGRRETSDAWAWGTESSEPDKRDLSRPGPEEQHLLDNLGYLTSTHPRGRTDEPGGPSGFTEGSVRLTTRMQARAAVWATIVTGLLINVVVVAACLLAFTIPLAALMRWLSCLPGDPWCTGSGAAAEPWTIALAQVSQARSWGPPVGWLGAWLVASAAWVAVSTFKNGGFRLVAVLKALVLGCLALGVTLALLLVGLPLLVALVDRFSLGALIAAAVASAGTIASVGRILTRFVARLAPKLGGIAFSVLLLLVIGSITRWFWFDVPPIEGWIWFGVTVLALAVVGARFSPEGWSMFAYYRGRLRSAYALRRVERGDGVTVAEPYVNDPDAELDPTLVAEPDLRAFAGESKLRICASAHATTRGVRTHYGIPAMSFSLDPEQVRMTIPLDDQGGASHLTCDLAQLETAYGGSGYRHSSRRITTMFAVALSAAAVSPAMGRFGIGPTSMLLATANVRLGAWLPNPRYVAMGTAGKTQEVLRQNQFPAVRLGYLFKEFFALHDPTDPFVYVTDGGHWENTGLVELLRDGMYDEVVCVDADSGSAATVVQLAQAIDLAKLECATDIFVDLEPLRGFAAQEGGPVFAQQSVTVGLVRQGSTSEEWGLFWYCKPILTPDTPSPLLSHREIDDEYPATSTLDQFFDTSTYTAYRDLGRHNAERILEARARLVHWLLNESPDVTRCREYAADASRPWVVRTLSRQLCQLPMKARQNAFNAISQILAPGQQHGASGRPPTLPVTTGDEE